MNTMIHYVCTGTCQGVSDELKMCGAVDCPKHEKPLTPCECGDGLHAQVMTGDQDGEA